MTLQEKQRAACRAWYAKNRERWKAHTAAYRTSHRQERNARERGYYLKNIEQQRERSREKYHRFAQKYSAKTKEWRLNNREKFKGYVKRWRAKNRDKVNATHKRWAIKKTPVFLHHKYAYRARKKSLPVEKCGQKIAILRRESFCHWCCTKLSDAIRVIDHVIPLTRGGHHISDNLVASCQKCNNSRYNKLVEKWLPYQRFN